MKDEEMANEYATTGYDEKLLTKEQVTVLKCGRYDGFLAGLKAGRPQWHTPEETIDKDKVVLGHIKFCNKDRYSLVQWNGEWWYEYGTFNAEVRLIEWCEIPTFDKE